MAVVISILTQKGGVGKTTSTIHIGGALADLGYKVLLIDFDTQINLSIGCGIENFEYSIEHFLQNPSNQFYKHTERLYILPGSTDLKIKKLNQLSLKKSLKVVQDDFDFILIDCPPKPINEELSFGEIAVYASDFVLSPILADNYSIAGISSLIHSLNHLKAEHGLKVQLLGFFFNQVEERTVDFKEYYNDIKESKASKFLFSQFVRKDVNIKKAMKLGKTVFDFKPYGRASQDLRKLTNEILSKIA